MIWYFLMSLANTFWFWAPWNGPLTCSREGLRITQTDRDYLCWLSCMYQIPCISNVMKRKFVSEWDGISTSAFCPTTCGGEDTGNHFISISTLTRCPNTGLFKDERSMLFYVDCLTHPTSFSTTFDSKFCVCYVTFQGDYKIIWIKANLRLL